MMAMRVATARAVRLARMGNHGKVGEDSLARGLVAPSSDLSARGAASVGFLMEIWLEKLGRSGGGVGAEEVKDSPPTWAVWVLVFELVVALVMLAVVTRLEVPQSLTDPRPK